MKPAWNPPSAYFMIQLLAAVVLLNGGCRERQIAVAELPESELQAYAAGRLRLSLPHSAVLHAQDQSLYGIAYRFEPAVPGGSIDSALGKRQSELLKDPRSPIDKTYRWTADTGGFLYLADLSVPGYFKIDGLRTLGDRVLIASTSGHQKDSSLMESNIRQALASFVPGPGNADKDAFAISGGTLHQTFRDQEEMHALFEIPSLSSKLELDTTVVADPEKVDLFERAKHASEMEGGPMLVLEKSKPTVASQTGEEIVLTGSERGVTQYDARFEASGRSNSPDQPELKVHFYTDGPGASRVTKEQFLATWNSILQKLEVAQ